MFPINASTPTHDLQNEFYSITVGQCLTLNMGNIDSMDKMDH